MIFGLHLEVVLALAYALFLAAVAMLLEFLARCSQKRAQGYRNSGFVHFRELNYWQCPAGHQLLPIHAETRRGTSFYKAPASACNSCSLKLNCTDSDEGRLLESRLDTWLDSELRRFHRGISLALLLLAIVLLIAETFRFSGRHDREALAALLIPLGFFQLRLWPQFGAGLIVGDCGGHAAKACPTLDNSDFSLLRLGEVSSRSRLNRGVKFE
jgi:hypothetical protein